jgi:DNA-binding GntR family transcriptional regulator
MNVNKTSNKKPAHDVDQGANIVQIDLGGGLVRKSLARQVYDLLERSIVGGGIPPGTRLSEEAVGAAFSVSRGPAREAIAELERTGLAERLPNRDRRVTVPSEQLIRDTYEAWTILESHRLYAASLVADQALLETLDTMLADMNLLTEQGDASGFKRRMSEFHSALQDGCPNMQINRIADSFYIYIRWFRNVYVDYHDEQSEQAAQEHYQIVQCFKARNKSCLMDVMRKHLEFHRDRILSAWQNSDAIQLIESGQVLEFRLDARLTKRP